MNIYQRLNEVRKAVNYLQKDATVEGYRVITHDLVTSEVRGHFIEHGIMVVPCQTDAEITDAVKTTKGGTPILRYRGEYAISFVNIDDPTDRVVVELEAMAEDHGDKAPGKSLSMATKYAMLKILSIETGESEESRQDQKPIYISDDQVIELDDLIKETKSDKQKFLDYLKVKSVDRIPDKQYQVAKAALENKKIVLEKGVKNDRA